MKYSACFINIQVLKEKNKVIISFEKKQSFPSGEKKIILVCKEEEYEFKTEAVTFSDNMIEISMKDYLADLPERGMKWEVYLQVGDIRYRLEHSKNRGRKRYQNGKRVKPYKEKKGVYNNSDKCMDALFSKRNSYALLPRFTRDWQLMFQVLPAKDVYLYRYFFKMERLEVIDGQLILTLGKDCFDFQECRVKMTLRETDKSYELEPVMEGDSLHRQGMKSYRISLDEVDWEPFFWDFSVEAEKDGQVYECKLRNYTKGFCGNVRERRGDFYLFSYYTQNDNIILHYRPYSEYDDESYRKREKKAVFLYHLLKPFYDMRGIVLMYEKFCKCAQDNAFYLFEYYMKKGGRDKRKTYYIIDSREPDAKRLKKYGKHVIEFMSLKHMIYIQAAKLLVSTDTIKHAYQWRGENTEIFDKLLTKHSVFLQHGVLALKRVEYIYNKNGGNKTDLFISSSKMEQQIITENFRYSKAEVPVTGLARWSALENKEKENSILVMPTWRNWIIEVTPEQFVETDYYKNYMSILNSKELASMLEAYDTKLIFCMHPKFREFIGQFETASDRILLFDYDKKPINEMVMEASMMVTDYSSVSWDMYYMEKPIVFYQFDYARYMEEQGSYIDMTKELYGDRAETPDELFSLLLEYVKNGFAEKKKYADLRSTYLPCRDGLQCQRIDKAIKEHAFTRLQSLIKKL